MKYIVFSYNLPTLCRAIKYTDVIFGKNNTSLVYIDLVSAIPQQIKEDYNVIELNSNFLDKKRGLELIIGSCIITNKLWGSVKKVLDDYRNDDVTLVVFRDNEIQEATLIKRIKKYKKDVNILLMEEGSGIYALDRVAPRFKLLKKIIYSFFGIGSYSLSSYPQGMNKNINKIICSHPESMSAKKIDLKIVIEKMIPIFTYQLNAYIISSVLDKVSKTTQYDYVFLTQPITDFRRNYDELLENHHSLLPKIFDCLKEKGKTIIKLHPRESYDYTQFEDTNIAISSPDESILPFECLMQFYGNPQMISMFSSTSISINADKPSLYLYKMFSIPGVEKLYSENHLKNNNILVCESLDNFLKSLV